MSTGHTYDACVIACMDHAIKEGLGRFEADLGLNCDEIKVAGGIKGLAEGGARCAVILEDIRLSVEKHGVGRVILVNHENCGKYGGSARFSSEGVDEGAFHREELLKAKAVVVAAHPDISVTCHYLKKDGTVEEVR